MSPPVSAAARMSFVLLGNAPEALEWLGRLLALTPDVRLLDASDEDERTEPVAGVTGMVLNGLDPDSDPRAAQAVRIAFVLEDPVRLLADGDESSPGAGEPVGYARLLRSALASRGDRALVTAASEMARPAALRELLEHLGLEVPEDEGTLGIVAPPRAADTGHAAALSPGQRARLFARVRDDVEELERVTGRSFRAWRFGGEIPDTRPAPRMRRLCYVGRRRDAEAPSGSLVLDDWGVLPFRLAPLLDRMDGLTVLDPMSFPFDAMRPSDRDIPIAVQLPPDWDADDLVQVLGRPLLAEIGPFDSVSAADDETWTALRTRYSWPAGVRTSPDELKAPASPLDAGAPGAARRQKSVYRLLSAAAKHQLNSARAASPAGELLSAVVLADNVERWACLFPLGAADVIGVDHDPAEAHRAAHSFPEWTFTDQLPSEDHEPEIAHVALCIQSLCRCPPPERGRRLASLLRILRVGGQLIVLDEFFDEAAGRPDPNPTPRGLMTEVSGACAGHVVLEHMQTHRLPGGDLTSVGLFAFTKLGGPQRL